MLTNDEILYLSKKAIWLILKISMPILLPALITGLIIAFFQAITQIQENTLVFVGKMLVVMFIIIISMPHMGNIMSIYTSTVFEYIGRI